MTRLRRLACCALLASTGLLAACTKPSSPRTSPTATAAPSASATTVTELIVAHLGAAGLAIGTVNEFLAGHDPNPPLGLAGSYAGGTWHDRTLQRPAGDTSLGFEDGGTVEVFASQADREARQTAFATLPANGGTVIGNGPSLMLLSPLLAPDVVARYRQAFLAL
ncbi:MAG TPA: hypothetical protein VET24_17220 [Actinomycetota bacterium]|nr:hypothetical protein [Actinomycetota bacterium]